MPTKGGALRVFYLPCSAGWKWSDKWKVCHNIQTETQSRNIHNFLQQKIPAGSFLHNWYRVERAGVSHRAMPAAYGFQLLDNAGTTILSPKPSPPPPTKPACCASWDSTKWNNSCRPASCPGKPEQGEVKKAAGMSHVMSRI
jgi:hypothetical protein